MLIEKYVVYDLDASHFKPFEKTFGPVSVDPITPDNVEDVTDSFSPGKVPVFREKLRRGQIGVYGRHKDKAVGYMWCGEYDSDRTIKADGYVPLKGHFCHIHFAQVTKEMRGRGLQLLMATWLIKDAFSRSVDKVYTDIAVANSIAMRGMCKLGFQEMFRFLALRPEKGPSLTFKYKNSRI